MKHSQAGGAPAPLDLRIRVAIAILFAASVALLPRFGRDERVRPFPLEVPVRFVMILLLLIGLG